MTPALSQPLVTTGNGADAWRIAVESGARGEYTGEGRRRSVQRVIHVVLAPDPTGGEPAMFYPHALVLVEVEGQLTVHHVYEDDRHAVGSRMEANGIILPVIQRWLRDKGWRTYEVFFPDLPHENAR